MATVAEINAHIEQEKAAFNAARARIAMLLAPAMPKAGAEDIFIAHAYDNGVDATLEDCQGNAGYFDLTHPVDAALALKIDAALRDANSLNNRVVDLVAARENLLMAKDPAHKPTYFWLGREFTIDPKMETMTYTDTGEVCAFLREDKNPKTSSSPSKGMRR